MVNEIGLLSTLRLQVISEQYMIPGVKSTKKNTASAKKDQLKAPLQ